MDERQVDEIAERVRRLLSEKARPNLADIKAAVRGPARATKDDKAYEGEFTAAIASVLNKGDK